MTAPSKTAAKRTREERAKDLAKRKKDRKLSDIRFVLKSPEGRRFIWRILSMAGIYQDLFKQGEADTTNFNLGRRSLGLDIFKDVMLAKPAAVQQMSEEYSAELRSEQAIEMETRKNDGDLV